MTKRSEYLRDLLEGTAAKLARVRKLLDIIEIRVAQGAADDPDLFEPALDDLAEVRKACRAAQDHLNRLESEVLESDDGIYGC